MSKILTYSGRWFDFDSFDSYEFSISEIAHSLSYQCRYNGHCSDFFSIAQHSVIVSSIVASDDPRVRMQALLHDATECYMGDVVSPLKKKLKDFSEKEKHLFTAIAKNFNIDEEIREEVALADYHALILEMNSIFDKSKNQEFSNWISEEFKNLPEKIKTNKIQRILGPSESMSYFLSAFVNISKEMTRL